MRCMRRREKKGLCGKMSLQEAFMFLSILIIFFLLTIFSYCFYFVYTVGYIPNVKYLHHQQDPVRAMTDSLDLNKSILGRFFLTRYLCLASVQLISGSFL